MHSTFFQRRKLKRLADLALAWSRQCQVQMNNEELSKVIQCAINEAEEQKNTNINERLSDQNQDIDEERIRALYEVLAESYDFPSILEQKLKINISGFKEWKEESVDLLRRLNKFDDSRFIASPPTNTNLLSNLNGDDLLESVRTRMTFYNDSWSQYLIICRNILLETAENSRRKRPLLEQVLLTLAGVVTTAILGWVISNMPLFTEKELPNNTDKTTIESNE